MNRVRNLWAIGNVLLLSGLLLVLGCSPAGGGGDTGTGGTGGDQGGDGGGDSGSGAGSLTVVFTEVVVDSVGAIRAGDDLVVVGTDMGSGIEYMIPSAGDTTARTISNSEAFIPKGFVTAGKNIVMRDFDGTVKVFDTASETLTTMPVEEFSVLGGNGTLSRLDFFADGNLVGAAMDTGKTTDGAMFKILDLSTVPPTVLSFQNPPEGGPREDIRGQVSVDAGAMQMVGQVGDQFVLYDISDPSVPPQVIDVADQGGIANGFQIYLDDGHVMHQEFEFSPNNRIVTSVTNLATGISTELDNNPSAQEEFVLAGGLFGYFVFNTDEDIITNGQTRSVWGQIIAGGTPESTFVSGTDDLIGEDRTDGLLGYGTSMTITPDGRFRFIAGGGTIGTAEYIQVSTGGAFTTFPDAPGGDDPFGRLPGSEVHASNSVCAFRTPGGVVAYIVLE